MIQLISKQKQKNSFENDGLILIYIKKLKMFCKVLTFVKGLFYYAFSVFTLVSEHIGMLVLLRAACRFLRLFFFLNSFCFALVFFETLFSSSRVV